MRRRLDTSRIAIQSKKLPESAYATGLNYRTKVTSTHEDEITTLRFLFQVTTAFMVIGYGLRFLALLPYTAITSLIIFVSIDLLGVAYAKFITRKPPLDHLLIFLAVIGASGIFGLVNVATSSARLYLAVFGVGVGASAALSYFITRQVCFFMAVNERIEWECVNQYRDFWSTIWKKETPPECPEIASFRESFFALLAAFGFGFSVLLFAQRGQLEEYALLLGVAGFLGSLFIFWISMNSSGDEPKASLFGTLRITKRALTTFVCYNRHGVQAAGLFQFPTPFLRWLGAREVALGATIAVLTTAFVCSAFVSPQSIFEHFYPAPKIAAAPPLAFQLSPVEERFSAQLAPEQRPKYFEEKQAAWRAHELASRYEEMQSFESFILGIVVVLVLCGVGPALTFFAVLWFTGGRLLLRYHLALEAEDAYEVKVETAERIAAKERTPTPWDNRIERIRLSSDPLEREHFYLGAALEGDFPVLLHRDLLQGHAHILGDTGSRKTSIGIAPLLTQLIAREDCSVLIIDLKGDKALFEAAREEADAAGIPFKWFSNITGISSFVFNPFAQSHLPSLTTNQLTEGIMQALALDYGEDYGRGFYSALNDLVLGGYLKRFRRNVRSFKELYGLVADKANFRDIGSDSDWEKARHIARVIEKLADVEPLNVTKETARTPQVIEEQIDLPTMLREKQVVYFYLSSIQEQSNAQKLAKLAMFSLLTAADRRASDAQNRVFVFIDEFQRIVTENISIVFEQARSKRLHFILANQTIGQLNKQGVDLTDVVESCTAFKQSFRATDEKSIKRLMETSGEALYHSLQWTQLLDNAYSDQSENLSLRAAQHQNEDGYAETKVSEASGPKLEKNSIIDFSARPLASFVRFTESKGYTQYSGYPFAIVSEYHITETLFGFRENRAWPELDERTIIVTAGETPTFPNKLLSSNVPLPIPTDIPSEFEDDIQRRINESS